MTALLGLAARLKLAKLMLITDARLSASELSTLAVGAFNGGVDIIQLRGSVAESQRLATGLALLERHAGRSGLVSAYGSAEMAVAAQVDVLQLSALDGPAAEAHAGLGQWALVGRSCHSPAQVDEAVADPGIDFFTVSPVFNAIGVGEAGMSLVEHAAAVAPASSGKPWFAVGGVNLDNLDQVLAAGARRVGVTRAIAGAADVEAAAAALSLRLTQAWDDDPGMQQVVRSALS